MLGIPYQERDLQMKFDGLPEILISNGVRMLMHAPYRGLDYHSAMVLHAHVSSSAQLAMAIALLRIAEALERPSRPTNQIGFQLSEPRY